MRFQVFMSKKNYNEIKLIKKRKKFSTFFKIFSFILFVVCFGLFFAEVFSSAVSNGTISVFSSPNNISYKPQNLYVLSLGEYNEKQKAEEVANVAGSWGAAAYIAEINDKFEVVGSVYSTFEDSENVRKNLQLTNYNTKTFELKYKKVNFGIKDITKQDKLAIKDALKCFDKAYKDLYDISIKIDKGEVTNIVGSGLVNTVKSEIRVKQLNLNTINLTYNNEVISKISQTLIKLEDALDLCVNQLLANSYINHSIKYCLCESVFLQYNLINNL